MKILSIGLAVLALLPAPALADNDHSIGTRPWVLGTGSSGTFEVLPNFKVSSEPDGLHVYMIVQQHHRYGTFSILYEGACSSLGVRGVYVDGVTDEGMNMSGDIRQQWGYDSPFRGIVEAYCEEAYY